MTDFEKNYFDQYLSTGRELVHDISDDDLDALYESVQRESIHATDRSIDYIKFYNDVTSERHNRLQSKPHIQLNEDTECEPRHRNVPKLTEDVEEAEEQNEKTGEKITPVDVMDSLLISNGWDDSTFLAFYKEFQTWEFDDQQAKSNLDLLMRTMMEKRGINITEGLTETYRITEDLYRGDDLRDIAEQVDSALEELGHDCIIRLYPSFMQIECLNSDKNDVQKLICESISGEDLHFVKTEDVSENIFECKFARKSVNPLNENLGEALNESFAISAVSQSWDKLYLANNGSWTENKKSAKKYSSKTDAENDMKEIDATEFKAIFVDDLQDDDSAKVPTTFSSEEIAVYKDITQ